MYLGNPEKHYRIVQYADDVFGVEKQCITAVKNGPWWCRKTKNITTWGPVVRFTIDGATRYGDRILPGGFRQARFATLAEAQKFLSDLREYPKVIVDPA